MSDQTTGRRRRRRTTPLLEDDDLLGEILARVPPEPSSLLGISIVCKRWQRLVSSEWFRCRLFAHHQKAPLLGFFEHRLSMMMNDILFNPIMEPPDRIHPRRSLLTHALAAAGQAIELLGCRHGHVIFTDMLTSIVFTCDPVTGGHARLTVPPEFPKFFINGTVLCTAGDNFKVVLVSMFENDRRPTACVYSSKTGLWGNIIRHDDRDHPRRIAQVKGSSIVIGHALYRMISFDSHIIPERHGVLEFDLDRQVITIMKGPRINHIGSSGVIKTDDGGVGLVTLRYRTLELQVWHRNVNCHDVATWVLFKTADLHSIFGLQWHERWPEPICSCFNLTRCNSRCIIKD